MAWNPIKFPTITVPADSAPSIAPRFVPQPSQSYYVTSAISLVIIGPTITATALATGYTYFYWYLDGQYQGRTTIDSKTFITTGILVVLATNDPDFPFASYAPLGFPATRALLFVRSIDRTINGYYVQQSINSGSWTNLGYIPDTSRQWSYLIQTPRLTDLATYQWQVVPVGSNGGLGTPASIASEFIVRNPDAVNFSTVFGSDKLTFSEAA
jgi:hypothetical protein